MENQISDNKDSLFNKSKLDNRKYGLGMGKFPSYLIIGIIDIICLFLTSIVMVYLNIGGYLPLIIFFTFITWLDKKLYTYFTSPKKENTKDSLISDSEGTSGNEDEKQITEQIGQKEIDSINSPDSEVILDIEDSIEETNTEPQIIIENTEVQNIIKAQDVENLNEIENERTFIQKDVDSSREEKETLEQTINQRPTNSQKKSKIRWWRALILSLLAIFSMAIGYIFFRAYPEYLNSWPDKIKYTFNQPNNELANKYYEMAMSHHHSGDFVVKRGNNIEYLNYYDVYKNTTLYSHGCELYAADLIERKNDIIDTCKYYISYFSNRNFEKYITSGKKIIENYDILESNLGSIYIIKSFNLNNELSKEKELIKVVQNIPVTDNDLINYMYNYYDLYDNHTLLIEFFDNNYKYNKDNIFYLHEYAKANLLAGDYSHAKDIIDIILKKNPKDTEALTSLAEAFCKENDWGKAKEYAQKAIDYGTENSDAYFILAEALYKSGNKKEARIVYNRGFAMQSYSDLKYEYKEAGGCPFVVNSIDFAFTNYDGKIITDYGQKLLSSKSQYITPRLHVTTERTLISDGNILQCKLFQNGKLETGSDSKNGYTFEWECNWNSPSGNTFAMELMGWGAPYSGAWSSGNYRFEVYFNDELIGEESFHIY